MKKPRPASTAPKKPAPRSAKPAASDPPSARRPVPCTSCGLCCTYVAIEVDSPNTLKRATQLLWYLYHERISLYQCDDEWMVQFESRCRHLQDDNRCGVYETRPHICREFSEKDCEVNTDDSGQTFYTSEQFLAHMKQKRPRIYAQLQQGFMPPPDKNAPPDRNAARRLPLFEQRLRDIRALGEV